MAHIFVGLLHFDRQEIEFFLSCHQTPVVDFTPGFELLTLLARKLSAANSLPKNA